jgi:hypothetical protein
VPDPRFIPSALVTDEGQQWGAQPGAGDISAGRYEGPEAHTHAPWKCPACGVQNEGPLPQGCTQCGSGKPGFHVGNPPPPLAKSSPAFAAVKADLQRGMEQLARQEVEDIVDGAFRRWFLTRYGYTPSTPAEDPASAAALEGFRAGWIAGAQNQAHRTMAAPPVTADIETLAPEGKPRRTIIAALEIFKDQILSQAPEEIATGEWCSVEEVETLIAQLRQQESDPTLTAEG